MNYRDNNRINCYEAGSFSLVKQPVLLIFTVQGYLRLAAQGKYKGSGVNKREITHFQRFAVEFATGDVKMHVP